MVNKEKDGNLGDRSDYPKHEKWEMGSPQNRRQSDEWGRVYDEGNIWKEIRNRSVLFSPDQ